MQVSLWVPSGKVTNLRTGARFSEAKRLSMCAGGMSSSLPPERSKVFWVIEGTNLRLFHRCVQSEAKGLRSGATAGIKSGIEVNEFSTMRKRSFAGLAWASEIETAPPRDWP